MNVPTINIVGIYLSVFFIGAFAGVLLTAICLMIEMCDKSPDMLVHFRKVSCMYGNYFISGCTVLEVYVCCDESCRCTCICYIVLWVISALRCVVSLYEIM